MSKTKKRIPKPKFRTDFARELWEQKEPSSNRELILLCIIDKNEVIGIKDFSYMAGFRTRISELRRDELIPEGIKVTTTYHLDYGQFGNPYKYAKHTVDGSELTLSILKKLYLKYEKQKQD